MQVHYFKSLFRLKAVNLQVLLTQGSSTSFLTILNILQLSKRAVDGNLDLETPLLCEFSLDEAYSQEYDNNIIDIDISHDIFDVGYHLPLVLGTLYKGIGSVFFHYQNLGKYFLVSIKMNSIKNYDKLILTSSFGTLSSSSAFSCDHNKLLFKLANMSDENILKADILLPPSAPHKYLDLK